MQTGKYKLLLAGKESVREVIWSRLVFHKVNPQQVMDLTAFGVYMRYPNKITRSNRLIHYLISREVVGLPDPDPTAIFFRVNNKVVRFGRMEFALVTGLRFGPRGRFDPFGTFEFQPHSIYSKCFNSCPTAADELWNFFTDDANFKDNDEKPLLSAVDCIRLCQVVIAVHIVLGLESSTKIPEWVWALVEHQALWNEFPWGSVSFQVLVKNLKGVKYSIPSKTYHLNGNILAFLVRTFSPHIIHFIFIFWMLVMIYEIYSFIYRAGFTRHSRKWENHSGEGLRRRRVFVLEASGTPTQNLLRMQRF